MKIAIDVSPLQSGHKVRGVGFYLEYLKRSLVEDFPEYEYNFFTNTSKILGKTDLVHYPYFDPFFLTLPLRKKHKTVVTVHDLTPLVYPKHFPVGLKGNVRWQIQKYNLQKVDAIIADSHASKNDIMKLAKIPDDKIFVIHLAAGKEFQRIEKGESRTEKVRDKYKLPSKFALYVGDVTWNKNVPHIVKAAIQAEIPLVMVGKTLISNDFDRTNPWNNDLIEVQKLALAHPSIMRLGFIPTEDIVALYNIATVFVFPSIYEGFGLPVIEAMQSGCPVITSQNGSLKEVAGDAAYIVDPLRVESIASGITKIFQSEKLQNELRVKGIIQAKKFNWKKTAFETIEVYKKVLNQ